MSKTGKYHCTIGRSDSIHAITCSGSIAIHSDGDVYLQPADARRFAVELSDLADSVILTGPSESEEAVRQELALSKKCLSAIREALGGDGRLSDSELPEAVRSLTERSSGGFASLEKQARDRMNAVLQLRQILLGYIESAREAAAALGEEP